MSHNVTEHFILDWGGGIETAADYIGLFDPGRPNDAHAIPRAMLISLYTWRRADAGDLLPDEGGSRQGWWADQYSGAAGDESGSRLWQLARSMLIPSTLRAAEDFAREALAWMIEDRLAASVDVEAVVDASDRLGLLITVGRPDPLVTEARYDALWEAWIDA